jgi:integrase
VCYNQIVPQIAINGTLTCMVSQNFKGKSVGRRSTPNTINGTVPPRRPVNADRRPSKYLTPKEIELLRKAARECGRYGHRDATMILIAYRHGLRPVEVCTLRWDQVDLAHELLHVRPVKNGMPSVHPIAMTPKFPAKREKNREIFPISG